MLKQNKKLIFILLSFASSFFIGASAKANTYFLAPPAGGAGGSGTLTDPWHDLNYALNKFANDGVNARVRAGDTLLLRGGTYDISAMTTPPGYNGPIIALNTNASSATTTIKSYPGEWAVLDGMNTKKVLQNFGVIYNITFQDLEVKRGYGQEGEGFAFGTGGGLAIVNGIFHNIYFHDNTYSDYNYNPAGMHLAGSDCVIEYCTFENNGTPGTSHHNSANLILYNQYNDSSNNLALGQLDSIPRKNNIIRYNRFIGSAVGIKDKGENNLVDMRPEHDPVTERHTEWFNEIEHNVFINSANTGYYLHQDFVKVHDNLFLNNNNGILYDGYEQGTIPLIWEAQIYNNTFVNSTGNDIRADESILSNNSYGGYDFNIYNNLIVSPQKSAFSFFAAGYDVGPIATWPMEEDYNGVDSRTSKPFGFFNVSNWAGVAKNFSQWQALGYGAHDLYTALSLNADYTLPSNSAAIGAGKNGEDLGAFASNDSSWYDLAGYTSPFQSLTYTISNFISTCSFWLKSSSSDTNSDNIINSRDLGVMMSKWN